MPSGRLRSFLEETSSGRTDTSELPLSSFLSGGHSEGTHAVRKHRKTQGGGSVTIPLHQSLTFARTSTPDLPFQPSKLAHQSCLPHWSAAQNRHMCLTLMTSFCTHGYLVKQVSLFHQLLQKNDQNIRLGSSHGPRGVS